MALKILIVNDDGINAPGIAKLALWAKKLGEVLVCAPKTECSAQSQSINIRTEFEAKRVYPETLPGIPAYSVASTPADCVRYALRYVGFHPDIVFTGINNGLNIGSDINYSATSGSAAEAVLNGYPAVAFSVGHRDMDSLRECDLDNVWNFICENELFERCRFLNVNFPPVYRGIAVTSQGGDSYCDSFAVTGPDTVRQVGKKLEIPTDDISVDTKAIAAGYISISPLTTDKTDRPAFEKLKVLNAGI